MKGLIKLLVVVLVVVVALAFSKDIIIKNSVQKAVDMITGLKLGITAMSVGVLKTDVDIKGLKLYNPKGFKDPFMFLMPRAYVDYDFPAVIKGDIHLKRAVIDLKEFYVVRNERGELNLDSLKAVRSGKKGKAAEPSRALKLRIDRLKLKIGKVIFKDYSKGGEPFVQEFNIGLEENFSNIDDPNELVSLLVVRAMSNTAVAQLANFDLRGLSGNINDVLSTATDAASGVMSGLGGSAGEEASQTVKQATEAVRKLLPFGGEKE